MASTILYKFRSGTTFEALPLPGSAARLFDVKKAIVKAKKLDSGSMEFDLGVRNADTSEEYSNEAMLLPRGTRLIVQRLPAQRGHGFLARMARNEQGGTGATQASSAPNSFYTIESRAGDDDEFVQAPAAKNEENELAALQAATNLQSDGPAMTGGGYAASRSNFPGSGGGGGGAPKRTNFHAPQQFRPNADPELREQEKKLQPKKGRTTGIPRTFQSLQAPPPTDGEEGDDTAVAVLQPNSQGFKDLVSRGGGQSENVTGTRHDLEYALKLTASTVPDYLLCPICEKVLRNATLLPWDPEGRSTCESCIRDALTQSGFRCPLTGIEGVSPDDLLPNIGLRKAVDMFVKGVMDKVDEVEQMRVEEDDVGVETTTGSGLNGDILEGDGIEKGVIVSRKSSIVRNKFEEDDPFADDDDFGGDVFAVDVDKPKEEETEEKKEEVNEADAPPTAESEDKNAGESKEADSNRVDKDETNPNSRSDPSSSGNAPGSSTSEAKVAENENDKQGETLPPPKRRRRGPPAGYTMGPAGYNRNKDGGDRRGGRFQKNDGGYRGGRGGGGGYRGGRDNDYNNRGGGHYDGDGGNDQGQDDGRNRGSKRIRNDDHSDGHRDKHARHERYDDRDNRYRSDEHEDRSRRDGGGRGSHRGGYRGGRGRWGGRGGGGGFRGHGRRH
ncbi:MAG: hypothetical protein SGBAC_003486 [Bacillariaceae sp.]